MSVVGQRLRRKSMLSFVACRADKLAEQTSTEMVVAQQCQRSKEAIQDHAKRASKLECAASVCLCALTRWQRFGGENRPGTLRKFATKTDQPKCCTVCTKYRFCAYSTALWPIDVARMQARTLSTPILLSLIHI